MVERDERDVPDGSGDPPPHDEQAEGYCGCNISVCWCIAAFLFVVICVLCNKWRSRTDTEEGLVVNAPTPPVAIMGVVPYEPEPWTSNHTIPSSIDWPEEMRNTLYWARLYTSRWDRTLWTTGQIPGKKKLQPLFTDVYEAADKTRTPLLVVASAWNTYQTLSARANERAMATIRKHPLLAQDAICLAVFRARSALAYVVATTETLIAPFSVYTSRIYIVQKTVWDIWHSTRVGLPNDARVTRAFKKVSTWTRSKTGVLPSYNTTLFELAEQDARKTMHKIEKSLGWLRAHNNAVDGELASFRSDLNWIDNYLYGVQRAQDCVSKESAPADVDIDADLIGIMTDGWEGEDVIKNLDLWGVRLVPFRGMKMKETHGDARHNGGEDGFCFY